MVAVTGVSRGEVGSPDGHRIRIMVVTHSRCEEKCCRGVTECMEARKSSGEPNINIRLHNEQWNFDFGCTSTDLRHSGSEERRRIATMKWVVVSSIEEGDGTQSHRVRSWQIQKTGNRSKRIESAGQPGRTALCCCTRKAHNALRNNFRFVWKQVGVQVHKQREESSLQVQK